MHGASSGSAGEVFVAALRLGLTSFGGPIAHLGYFRDEYVERRRWLDDHAFSELVGMCQFLPGPASSQLGFAIGWLRAGAVGALAAWIAFTLPSALLMFGFALASRSFHGNIADAATHGLKIAALAVVSQAVIGMSRTLTPDAIRMGIASAAAATILLTGNAAMQVIVIAGGGLAGTLLCKPGQTIAADAIGQAPGRLAGLIAFAIFGILLVALPVLAPHHDWLRLCDIFYRAGALVFGGGHVILPLLREGLVPHWMSDSTFLGGYGAAQAVPGPLFSIATYLGALARPDAAPFASVLATFAIFLPGLLLVTGALAFRRNILGSPWGRRGMAGANAAVVGILAAALYNPLWTTTVNAISDVVLAGLSLIGLLRFKAPPILIVGLCVAMTIAVGR